MRKDINILLLTIIADSLLFTILFSILSFNSRLASDDFYYVWLNNAFGAWKGMIYQYNNWSGRWSAHAIACWLLNFRGSRYLLPVINIGTLLSLYMVLRQLLNTGFERLKMPVSPALLPGLTILLITSFFFATYSIGESWFWYIIIVTYFWSLIAFLFLLRCVLSESSLFHISLAAIASVFIGGASESLAITFIFILAALLYCRMKFPGWKIHRSILVVSIALIILSLTVSVLAPGTDVRQSLLPSTSISFKILAYVKSFAKYFILYLPRHSGYLFLFSFPWLLFGMEYLKGKFNHGDKLRIIRNVTAGWICIVAVSLVPTSYVMSDAGPARAMLFVSFITAVYFAFLFAVTGTFLESFRGFNFLSALIGDLSIIVLCIFIYVQYNVTNQFAAEYDERMDYLHSAKALNVNATVALPALPDPGLLYWDEISSDSTYFINRHLQKGLQLPFSIVLKAGINP